MKTKKISFWFLVAAFMLLPAHSKAQHGPSAVEILTRNTWVFPNSNINEWTYTDSTITLILRVGDLNFAEVYYYYLSNTPDTLFQVHQIGTTPNGRFIHRILKKDLLENQLHQVILSEIFVINENELIYETIRKEPRISRKVRVVPKPE